VSIRIKKECTTKVIIESFKKKSHPAKKSPQKNSKKPADKNIKVEK